MKTESSFTTYDLSESLDRVGVDPQSVAHVLAAWGMSPDDYASWAGGFLLELKDDRYAYVWGWADTSGWGCQDGATLAYFPAQPDLSSLPVDESYKNPPPEEWDIEPPDLNLWLTKGTPDVHD